MARAAELPGGPWAAASSNLRDEPNLEVLTDTVLEDDLEDSELEPLALVCHR